MYESNIVETDLASIKSKKKFDQIEFKSSEIFDVIVVGSGPGGSLAANEVIKKYSKVLLIESGDNFEQILYNTTHTFKLNFNLKMRG